MHPSIARVALIDITPPGGGVSKCNIEWVGLLFTDSINFVGHLFGQQIAIMHKWFLGNANANLAVTLHRKTTKKLMGKHALCH